MSHFGMKTEQVGD